MKKIFLIQNEGISQEDFLDLLSKNSGLPLSFLQSNYKEDNQIIINEHYFKNFVSNYYKGKEYDEVLKIVEDNNDIDENSNLEVSVFMYKMLD